MTTAKHTAGLLRRTGRKLGRLWLHLANSTGQQRPQLTAAQWSDYSRFPPF